MRSPRWSGRRSTRGRPPFQEASERDPRVDLGRLELPVHASTRFVLVRPHYPENLGAAARAMRAMGFSRLALVRPGRLARPEHAMARRMAVKALDVLDGATLHETLDEALEGVDLALGTTGRRGVGGVVHPRSAAALALAAAREGREVAWVFGNEKSGLDGAALARCGVLVRIPMAQDQPTVNLAQAVQLLAWETFAAALSGRATEGMLPSA